ncbi:ROK family transcriptional regulator [Paenibacillus cremeus]|uniref:ROK family transcriptional regulator n=1 Tax=Paenibacillus cremeus TaxID=2163881 RepID=A0A559K7Q5_9BACL|nr:ROK family transcriptional regulator [Paenibacillus cremeus]TVY08165.1 ROK family transcriptional regulator [Paenibacillus cremeus]
MTQTKTIYLQQVKQQNLCSILTYIWEAEAISRVELIEKTGLTSGTITNLTSELIEWGLIRESETSSGTVGRKRIMLRFQPELYRIMGLDIGRSSIALVMTDLTGGIVYSRKLDTGETLEPASVLAAIEPLMQEALQLAASEHKRVLGIGVGIPGPMNLETGTLRKPPNFPGWDGYPIRKVLEERLGLPVQIEDDARTSALAERWFGHAKKEGSLVFVTMGMGIGSGIIAEGKLVRGVNGLYGQVGHTMLDPHGIVCDCGNRGCWETIGAIPGILRRYGGEGSMAELMEQVKRGDPSASQCYEETLYYLESALTNVFNMYDPAMIVLGGKLFSYLEPELARIRSRVIERVYDFVKHRVRIEAATFGEVQSAVGGAALVLEELIAKPLQVMRRS